MKKNILLFPVMGALFLFSSCKKEDSSTPGDLPAKVKSFTETLTSGGFSTSVTFNLSYDNSNRVISAVAVNSPDDNYLFTYDSNTRFSMDLSSSDGSTIHEDFFLNSASLIDSTLQYNDTRDTTTEKYFYNADKQLIRLNIFDYSTASGPVLYLSSTNTYDADGNLIQTSDTNGNSETFGYYPDLVYALPAVFPTTNPPQKMHLEKTHTVHFDGQDASTVLTYTFDSNGRISTITETVDDGSVDTKSFTYF